MSTRTASIPNGDKGWAKSIDGEKDQFYWADDIDHKIRPQTRHLLESYSKIPSDQIKDHIYDIRKKAWDICHYPCTGMGLWLDPILPYNPSYDTIVQRIKDGASFMDIGCFMGQDIRRLVVDGAPQENLYAADVVNFWDLGFEFFRDRDRFAVRNLHGDILNPGSDLKALKGEIDIISITNVLHLFDWAEQRRGAETLCMLSKPGTSIVGFQCGASEEDPENNPEGVFFQSPATWKRMWDEVGRNTGTTWDCQVKLVDWSAIGWTQSDASTVPSYIRAIRFEVTRKA